MFATRRPARSKKQAYSQQKAEERWEGEGGAESVPEGSENHVESDERSEKPDARES